MFFEYRPKFIRGMGRLAIVAMRQLLRCFFMRMRGFLIKISTIFEDFFIENEAFAKMQGFLNSFLGN
jgi:hypothetical protein